ncbi:MAG: tRNA pseudouridine(55) synthase TruB [Vicinamibacterales bacterium]
MLEPVRVTVHELSVTAFDGDSARLALRVSAGFYVRALAHDIGQVLGMGAVLDALRRTRSGAFGLEHAVGVEELATGSRTALTARMLPLAGLMPELPGIALSPDLATRARRGLEVPGEAAGPPDAALARLLDEEGRLLGIARPSARAGFLHPFVVLNYT